ncbi:CAP domain-containing protein [Halochromatium salexigens]|uniref:SCP domain-containing protein n=1 Tax=Halochromatium salexigens TaxID=49447 RepID=A0AAJ0XHT4_HALSE|nr:CAP domain-containing protein [Halochromatium salexigens]MBK5932161.1 hypothetical protein [Halochromatium salexigens]
MGSNSVWFADAAMRYLAEKDAAVTDRDDPQSPPIDTPTAFYTLTDATPNEFFLAPGLDAQILGTTAGKTINIPTGAAARGVDPETTVNLQGASAEYNLQRNGTTIEVRDAGDDSLIASLSASTTTSSSLRFHDGAVQLAVEDNRIAIGGSVLNDGEHIGGSALTLNDTLTSSGIFSGTNDLPGSETTNAFLTLTDTSPETFTLGAGLVLTLLGNSAGKSLNVPIGAGVDNVDPATTLNLEGMSTGFTFARNGTTLEVRDTAGNLTASLNASTTETSLLIFADGFMELAVVDNQITLGGTPFTDGLSVAGSTLSVDESQTSEAVFGTDEPAQTIEHTSYEQFMLELVNRARTDPLAEAARYDIDDLNDGLAAGTLSGLPMQPVFSHSLLIDAARAHSDWMLASDIFSHTGEGGSSAGDRMEAAGYAFVLPWTWGENLSWTGTTSALPSDLTDFILDQHEGLFRSPGHRGNLLNEDFREIGIGQSLGEFTSNQATFQTSMITQNFAASGDEVFLGGVVYEDFDDNDFYTPGEGLDNITISLPDLGLETRTSDAGGYQLAVPSGTHEVVFSGTAFDSDRLQTVTIGDQNEKLETLYRN